MNKACIVKAHFAGLFSNINKVITCSEIYDHVHVDWSNPDNIYKTPEGLDSNPWNHLFDATVPPSGLHDIISTYPHQDYTWKQAGHLYQLDGGWRTRLHQHWKRFTMRGDALDRSMSFNEFTIGVLVRSDAIAGEQAGGANATIDSYINTVRNVLRDYESKHPRVYAACSDSESTMRFIREFGALTHPYTKRAVSRRMDIHTEQPQNVADAINCLSEVISLSRCDVLVHQVSNMATAALYMNPNLVSVYIQ